MQTISYHSLYTYFIANITSHGVSCNLSLIKPLSSFSLALSSLYIHSPSIHFKLIAGEQKEDRRRVKEVKKKKTVEGLGNRRMRRDE